MNPKLSEWLKKKEILEQGGGPDKISKQHKQGKMTARERIDMLFDEGSFVEYGLFAKTRCTKFGMDKSDIPADGVIVGFGKINGRPAYTYAHDFTASGGTLGEIHSKKIHKVISAAIDGGVPCVALTDSGGGRIQEAIISQNFLELFRYNVDASGWIPQISAIMGPCAGGAAYSAALMDFVISVDKTSYMFLTGPKVIEQVTGEVVDNETLGGAMAHNSLSGVSHMLAADDRECIEIIKELLSYLPQNSGVSPPLKPTNDPFDRQIPELDDFIPIDASIGFDVKDIIRAIADDGVFMEHQPLFGDNIVTVLARMGGRSVGIVANMPDIMAGCLDINASDKGARFIRICDSFNIPLVWLTDVPGFLPGVDQEHGGVIRHGAKMVYACCEATVPKISVTLRKNYGGATAAMCAKEMGCDVNFIWPTGESTIMGADGAAAIIFKKEIDAAAPEEREALRKKLTEEYVAEVANPYLSTSIMVNDEIIRPADTRRKIIQCLEVLEGKTVQRRNKKHGNMPV
ncbi:MAG: acyl-CoA carboxylase subunit beta [Oscillospiraceae bacterium]|nr:acyl-CoA carboxylase subunit beta [Oscillospiraceae bacterium]